MKYEAFVRDIEADGYEGHFIIQIGEVIIRTYYQALTTIFAEEMNINDKIIIDLWLVYGFAKRINEPQKIFPTIPEIAGGVIKGQIMSIHPPRQVTVDCGDLVIDVFNEKVVEGLEEGDYIEASGTYQIFFPEMGMGWETIGYDER